MTCLHAYVHMYMYVCVHMCVYICVCVCVCMSVYNINIWMHNMCMSEQSPFEDSLRYVATAFVSCFGDRGENTEVAIVHSIVDINPGEPVHISRLLAFELTKHPRKFSV